jgi:hypothetical protein
MKDKTEHKNEFILSNKFLNNLKNLSNLIKKKENEKPTENQNNNNTNKILKLYPPGIEKINEEIYLDNDDIIHIINKTYCNNNKNKNFF